MEWTPTRRLQLVLSILKSETSVAQAARRYDLPRARIEDWQSRALRGAERELRPRMQPWDWSDLENYVECL